MTPFECTCSDNISCKCFRLFSLPSWRQCCSQCTHHSHVPMFMSNLPKLTQVDLLTTTQLEPSLQHGCDHTAIMHLPSWFALIPYALCKTPTASLCPLQKERFGGKHEILPREKASALSGALWLLICERRLLLMRAVSEPVSLFIFVAISEASCSDGSATVWSWLQMKAQKAQQPAPSEHLPVSCSYW